MPIRPHAAMFVHPGPWLRRNVLEPYGLNVTEAAQHLGVTRAPMSNLLNGKAALSPDMALRFEAAFGVDAETLVRMQAAYDLTQVRQTTRVEIARLPDPALAA